ncbi:hypothetical protein AGOR_G00131420 [Albula goreensis]|uniref:peptidylprolyl isomerase n=1 Tax=Albula goreensis TaxID=1534307 RepID=A0A8T3D7X3_9TELE|nr:hypothetical protein AGOR_G00131420 [Albula goreensis]
MKVQAGVILVVLFAVFGCGAVEETDQEQNAVEELLVETLVKPESCTETSEMGDTLQIHYTGKLLDGKVIDSSLSRDPLLVELGKRTVISGLEQSLLGVCLGQKIKALIPAHLAYGKRGYPQPSQVRPDSHQDAQEFWPSRGATLWNFPPPLTGSIANFHSGRNQADTYLTQAGKP